MMSTTAGRKRLRPSDKITDNHKDRPEVVTKKQSLTTTTKQTALVTNRDQLIVKWQIKPRLRKSLKSYGLLKEQVLPNSSNLEVLRTEVQTPTEASSSDDL